MALRITPTLTLQAASTSGSAACASSRRPSSFVISDRGGLKKQQQQQTRGGAARPVEDLLASRLGLEVAVADLERLFREAPGGEPPATPTGFGFSRRPLRVAYQGVSGSYCQEAAAAAFPRDAFLPCGPHMEDAFAALDDGSAARAVVPLENSLDGPIPRNLDLLLRHPGVRIVGELLLPVRHGLLALPGTPRSALRRVVGHAQALRHCRRGLEALGLPVEEVACAAEAARFVAEERIADTAVVGSRIAGREFGLRILEQDLQGPRDGGVGNVTRFLQLGPTSVAVPRRGGGGGGNRWRTTVAFSLAEGPSGLFGAMWAFESRGVRVSRVDHRPNRSRPVRVVEKEPLSQSSHEARGACYMDYVFVVEVDGAEWDRRVEAAIERLREMAGFVRVLGTYTPAG